MSLFKSLLVRRSQGSQFIGDLRAARPAGLRGLPVLADGPCGAGCSACRDACPTAAITSEPLSLDLGRCVFCGECVDACPEGRIAFSRDPRMAASEREGLVVRPGSTADPGARVRASEGFVRLFGRSLRLRQVSAGGCNACELELNAISNVNFDAQRYGIEWVASPRHADALVVTGPLTVNMRDAIRLAWDAVPEPRFVVAVGACAVSGGLYEMSPSIDRGFLADVGPALFVPGCPPHPLTVVNGILDLLGVE
jgi:Ni,Fe-hydrogenase III small subunit/ferredoxin